MGNPTTVAQWQQAKAALVTQAEQLTAQYTTLRQQGTQLAFQSADLTKQLKTVTDPVQRAQLQAQLDSVQTQLQQTNTKADETQTQLGTVGDQISTANDEINRASSGVPNTNTTTDPANSNPGSNTQVAPLEAPATVAVQYSVPPQLRTEVSPIGAGQFSYDVVDTERGKIIKSFDTQADADAYIAQQGSTPGSTSSPPISYAPLATAPETTTAPDPNNGAAGLGVDTAAVTIKPQESPNTIDVNNGAIGLGVDTSAVAVPVTSPPTPNTVDINNGAIGLGVDTATVAIPTSAPSGSTNATGVQKQQARSAAVNADASSSNQQKDWRVKLTLAKNANYLYKAPNPGILQPLKDSEGLVFPYTPAINVTYSAGYDMSDPVHSNYKIFQYKGSSVDNVQITCDFTAQDTNEAQYLLAVIHFLRSATKMFYGNDNNPKNGVPPPLVYLTGLGEFQFNNHPLLITNFTYSLPNDVDYIKAGSKTSNPGTSQPPTNGTNDTASTTRTAAAGLAPTAVNFSNQSANNSNATYVPTKMQLAITCIPVVSRNDISNRFSLREYATGALLRGNSNNAGGIW